MLGGRYFTTSLFSRNPFKSRSAHKENSKQILDEKKYKILEQQHEMSLVVPFVWKNIKNTKNVKKIQNNVWWTAVWDESGGAICVRAPKWWPSVRPLATPGT